MQSMSTSQMPGKTPESGQNTSPTPKVGVGVLLVHGLNGSRHDLQDLADLLTAEGMLAENMLLPGHGTSVRNMLRLGWPEWSAAVYSELLALKQRCDTVFLIGHSLGAALCLHIAAHEEVDGVVAMCPPLHMYSWIRIGVPLARHLIPLLPSVREDIRDPIGRRSHRHQHYRWTALAPVESMLLHLPQLRAELPHVTAPALIMVSLHDHVVPPGDGRDIYRLLGSQEKHIVTFYRSYHVITKDYDREEVFAKTLDFIRRHAARSGDHFPS
jgi:carboxylesterase